MVKSLVIVESPAKVKTLSKILGKDFTIKASMGHIRDLPKKGIGVRITKDFSFTPKYEIMPEKEAIIKDLTEAAQKCKHIFLAPDPDREGEAIAWHLHNIFKNEKIKSTIKRIEFNEITQDAILKAIKSPKEIDENRVNAQQTRRILDRLVGYKISPLLWKKIRGGLSAGRVQSVAVRLICEREEEVNNFVPQEFWIINEEVSKTQKGTVFTSELTKINNKKAEVKNEKEATKIQKELEKSEHIIHKIAKSEQKRSPGPPLITSSLQQEAARACNFTVKKTMSVAQDLYEGMDLGDDGHVGLITYMRTDSTRISEEALKAARAFISKQYGKEFLPAHAIQYKTKKGAQDAHEAIRPTDINRTPDQVKKFLNNDHYRLYKLIWNRFVASQMENALYDLITIDIKADKYTLRSSSSYIKFAGFQIVHKEETDKDSGFKTLEKLKEKDVLIVNKIEPSQHFTQGPSRYSEASLVKELEEKNIGRPSTYAPTISVILDRGYVEKDGKALFPTVLGKEVNNQLVNHFNDIINVDFTSNMENVLDKIEEGKEQWQKALAEFYKPFIETLAKATLEMKPVDIVSDELCDKCNTPMLIKTGRYGNFLACPNQECKHTKNLLKKIGVKCPTEGCDGDVIQKKSKKGFLFYSCSRYPDCKFASFNPPTEHKCPKCNSYAVVKFSKQKKPYTVCSNKECNTILKIKKAKKEEEAN